MTLPPLVHFQPVPPEPDENLGLLLRSHIEEDIVNQPRSQQARIGPSELGIPCDRCLAHKLAGTPERVTAHRQWLPYVGTAMHAQLADAFMERNQATGANMRWLVETTVSVGDIDGVDITGHADLFDLATGTVVDWKLVGKTTLDNALKPNPKTGLANGPTPQYRVQAHLYGRGFTRRGLTVNRVAIYYLPRNGLSLRDGWYWSEPYDERIAIGALDRANRIAKAIKAVGALALIPNLPTAPRCMSCHKYTAHPLDDAVL